MAQQAVQMGLLPRLEIRHTSETQRGQIFMPRVNFYLYIGVMALVLAFGSSTSLASAYGIAVTGDMVITSILASIVFLKYWNWRPGVVIAIMGPILFIELIFLGSNLIKVMDGGWVPLVMAASLAIMVWTWITGTAYVQKKARASTVSLETLLKSIENTKRLSTAPSTAIYLTSDPDMAPTALMHNIKHNHVLHERNLIVTVTVANTPYVADKERVVIEKLGERFSRIHLSFGYMEEPNVPRALVLARKQGEKFEIMSTSFFLNRRSFRSARNEGLPVWQEGLFVAMTKSASNATDFYRLPANRVIELGQQLTI
jgi:KUP system potassium uptake protein